MKTCDTCAFIDVVRGWHSFRQQAGVHGMGIYVPFPCKKCKGERLLMYTPVGCLRLFKEKRA